MFPVLELSTIPRKIWSTPLNQTPLILAGPLSTEFVVHDFDVSIMLVSLLALSASSLWVEDVFLSTLSCNFHPEFCTNMNSANPLFVVTILVLQPYLTV